jgi:serine phosphatase RsbU (regulator of sigma subunit)
MPFGCIEDLEVTLRAPMRMEPGDVFVVLSDGVIDAEGAGGERFGTMRVIEIITRHCGGTASELTVALRQAVADFTGAARSEDDRTGLVVKRG